MPTHLCLGAGHDAHGRQWRSAVYQVAGDDHVGNLGSRSLCAVRASQPSQRVKQQPKAKRVAGIIPHVETRHQRNVPVCRERVQGTLSVSKPLLLVLCVRVGGDRWQGGLGVELCIANISNTKHVPVG